MAKKIFVVEGHEIGLIYDPNSSNMTFGFFTFSSPAVFTEQIVPKDILNKVTSHIPHKFCSLLGNGRINGKSHFEFVGLK